jgi:integral membrane protein
MIVFRQPALPDSESLMTPRLLFRTVAIAEAITWALLIAGMVLKYGLQGGEIGVQVGGFVHGLVFLAFGMTALLVGVNQHWGPALTALAVVTAIIPFGTIILDRGLEKKSRLEGPWRRTRTADPRDHTRVSALLRWMLARPVLFATGLALGLSAVMAALLSAGPPGGAS